MTQTPVGTRRLQRSKKSRAIAGGEASERGSNGFGPRLLAGADPDAARTIIYSEYCLRLELQETPSPEEYIGGSLRS